MHASTAVSHVHSSNPRTHALLPADAQPRPTRAYGRAPAALPARSRGAPLRPPELHSRRAPPTALTAHAQTLGPALPLAPPPRAALHCGTQTKCPAGRRGARELGLSEPSRGPRPSPFPFPPSCCAPPPPPTAAHAGLLSPRLSAPPAPRLRGRRRRWRRRWWRRRQRPLLLLRLPPPWPGQRRDRGLGLPRPPGPATAGKGGAAGPGAALRGERVCVRACGGGRCWAPSGLDPFCRRGLRGRPWAGAVRCRQPAAFCCAAPRPPRRPPPPRRCPSAGGRDPRGVRGSAVRCASAVPCVPRDLGSDPPRIDVNIGTWGCGWGEVVLLACRSLSCLV